MQKRKCKTKAFVNADKIADYVLEYEKLLKD